ncbi:hypothetical protein [Rudaeicoccus suwonensis]|nr:hypothetical protein [Rudaeicoccus suwonensis]
MPSSDDMWNRGGGGGFQQVPPPPSTGSQPPGRQQAAQPQPGATPAAAADPWATASPVVNRGTATPSTAGTSPITPSQTLAGGDAETGTPALPQTATAPMPLIGGALLLAVIGLVVGLIWHGANAGVVGWLLAGPVAIIVVGVFLVVDGKRRGSGWYRPQELAPWLLRVSVVVSLVAVVLNAFSIANDVARGRWT